LAAKALGIAVRSASSLYSSEDKILKIPIQSNDAFKR